jgi:hypothetical protein
MTPSDLPRRDFLKRLGFGSALLAHSQLLFADERIALNPAAPAGSWPVLRRYDRDHQLRIGMPMGGIGTGTVSLGGRGDLRDWELMNRPSKGFVPSAQAAPFVAVYLKGNDGSRFVRVLEGPLDAAEYEGSHGSTDAQSWVAPVPRFDLCRRLSAGSGAPDGSGLPGRCQA